MKLIIEYDEGRKTVVPVVREEITIGRQDGNTIRLTERNVSRRHARLLKENGNLLIEDLGSYNGVRVNGEKITGPTKIKEGDLVEIGDYDLGIQGKLDTPGASPITSQPKQQTIPPGTMKAPAAAKPQPAPPPQATPPEPTPAPQPAPQAQTPSASAGGATAIIRVSDLMKSAPQVEARDLSRQEAPFLVGLAGAVRGKELYLMRTDENDLVVDHQSVSRRHARFVLDQGQWKVIDNKSANGVRVNGDEYAVSNIKPGDIIELGHLKFRFCAPGEKFKPPPEKSEEGKAAGRQPTTAELIAGATQPGRMATSSGATKKAVPPIALIGGIAGAVVVIAVVAFLVVGKKSAPKNPDEATGADAVKLGDVDLRNHHYRKALDLYDRAESAPTPNKKKAADEARGEETYQALKEAVDSGDGDKAKNLFEKCSSESTYWCGKAGEMKEQVAAAFAKKHLGAANAAKTSGKLDVCMNEVITVLAFDGSNSEAQALSSQCQPPQQAAQDSAPKHEGSSSKEREAKAAKLAKSSADKLVGRDFAGAVKDAQAAL